MRCAVEPGAHQPCCGVGRLLRPGDRLAELPLGATARVAGERDALAERDTFGRGVREVAPDHHVVGVALGGEGELGVLADQPQPARPALRADHAQQRGTAIGIGERGGEIVGVRAGGLRGRRDDEGDERRCDHYAYRVLAGQGARDAPRPIPGKCGSAGGVESLASGRRRVMDGVRQAAQALNGRGRARRPPSYAQTWCRKPPLKIASRPCSKA